jgi:hypothetical protein
MCRRLFAGLLGVAVAAAVVLPTAAQEKKDPPKKGQPKKERIAIADPAKAKEDPDFLVQGEYAGDVTTKDGKTVKFGAQVVARGEAKFSYKLYSGGLPGAGWDGVSVTPGEMQALRGGKGGTSPRSPDQKIWGDITDGKFTFEDAAGAKGALARVERKSPTLGAKPPEGAVVLFGGPGDEKNWNNGKLVELSDGKFLNMGITSKQSFGNFKAHVEFRTPWMPTSTGQGRGNSGVYLQNRYEVQVLDSFGLKGENNECGGIYTQHKPLVNMCLPPLAWQTYDIEFAAAEFEGDKRVKPARATIYHNGVKIHDNVEMKGPTGGGQPETAKPGPFQLQNHGDPLVYNNIWVVEMK